MITDVQRVKLKMLLKGNYISDVKKKLASRNILSKRGNPYSDKMISHVFNGRYENSAIEKAILDVYKQRERQIQQEQRYKNKILGISPDEA
ncbi:hypothetical protein [Ascidiimonas aurantiaca]|uniref:hypothetical protein n=1 Tax=Ascidiimonas aurantiaca TaxID=1685432 RepID=UPI0030EB2EC7